MWWEFFGVGIHFMARRVVFLISLQNQWFPRSCQGLQGFSRPWKCTSEFKGSQEFQGPTRNLYPPLSRVGGVHRVENTFRMRPYVSCLALGWQLDLCLSIPAVLLLFSQQLCMYIVRLLMDSSRFCSILSLTWHLITDARALSTFLDSGLSLRFFTFCVFSHTFLVWVTEKGLMNGSKGPNVVCRAGYHSLCWRSVPLWERMTLVPSRCQGSPGKQCWISNNFFFKITKNLAFFSRSRD